MKKYLFITMAIIGLVACNNKTEDQSTMQESEELSTVVLSQEQQQNIGLTFISVQTKNISNILKVNGVIDVPPQNMVSVSIPLGGYLKYTKLLPGMHFAKGEIIAVMEDVQYVQLQQDYLTTKAKFDYLQPELERQKELNQQKASSDKLYQQTLSDFNSIKITLNALKEKLMLIGINATSLTPENLSRTINIKAPIDGFVTKVNVNIGKYVNPTDVLFELVNPDDIHLNLVVFEKDLNKLYVGQTLFAFTNFNKKKYKCDVLLIGKDIGSDRSASVHCHFEQYDKTLLPGTYMNAEIEVSKSNTNVLPINAVLNYNNKQFIFVERNKSTYELIEVNTGIADDEFVEIMENSFKLIKGKKVVLNGTYNLLMQLKNTEE